MVKYLAFIFLFPSICLADQASSQIQRGNMLFQYFFNETAGTTFMDTSTNSFSAFASSGSGQAIVTGKHGNGLSMNGSGGLWLFNFFGDVRNTINNLTVAVSFKNTGNGNQTIGGKGLFFCQADAGGNVLAFGVSEQGLLGWVDNGTEATPILQTSNIISTGVWHHAVFVRKQNAYKKLYLDGNLIGTDVTNNVAAGNNMQDSTGMEIGGNAGSTNNLYKGTIDEITFWREAMSQGEIKEIYTQWVGRPRRSIMPHRYTP